MGDSAPGVADFRQQRPTGSISARNDTHAENEPLLKPQRLDFTKQKKCNDVFWAILFLCHLIGMIVLSVYFGGNINFDFDNNGQGFLFVAAMIFCGICCGYFSIKVLKTSTDTIIRSALLGQAVLSAIFGAVLIMLGSVGGGIIFCVLAAFLCYYYYSIKDRIPFTVSLIEIAIDIFEKFPSVVYMSLFVVILQAVWIVAWSIGLFGYIQSVTTEGKTVTTAGGETETEDEEVNSNGGLIFLFLLSLYWTLEVLRYAVHTIIAAITASWYFFPEKDNALGGATNRALTTSFGSICFGAFLIAFVRAVRAMIDAARSGNDGNVAQQLLACIASCILSCIEFILEVFNHFAFIYVAIYGYDFMTSAYMVVDIFKTSGIQTIINFDLTQSAMWACSVVSGLAVGAVSLAVAASGICGDDVEDSYVVYGFVGLIVGFFMCWIILQPMISITNTIFVVWAEDPQTGYTNHYQEFTKLKNVAGQKVPVGLRPARHEQDDSVGRV